MRLSESVRVPLFESLLPSLQPDRWRKISELVASPLVLEILLSHHVQLSGARQFCVARGLLARFLPNFVRRPLLRCSAMSGAMSIKHRHAAHVLYSGAISPQLVWVAIVRDDPTIFAEIFHAHFSTSSFAVAQ